MAEPIAIRIFVLDGDPDGVKIVDRLNWTGVGLAFPRSTWPRLRNRPEFARAGVYILTGTAEGTDDDLPTVYVGQGEEIDAITDGATQVQLVDNQRRLVSHARCVPQVLVCLAVGLRDLQQAERRLKQIPYWTFL